MVAHPAELRSCVEIDDGPTSCHALESHARTTAVPPAAALTFAPSARQTVDTGYATCSGGFPLTADEELSPAPAQIESAEPVEGEPKRRPGRPRKRPLDAAPAAEQASLETAEQASLATFEPPTSVAATAEEVDGVGASVDGAAFSLDQAAHIGIAAAHDGDSPRDHAVR